MLHTMMTNEITAHFKRDNPFNSEEPIRLFVGTSENFDPTIEKVYLYSILKRSARLLKFTNLQKEVKSRY